jgi:hypothetical protein
MVKDGYFDGLVDGYGNPTAYGLWMESKGWAQRTGDGMKLINGGVAMVGSPNNATGSATNPDGSTAITSGRAAAYRRCRSVSRE